jgi:excisionase family DNA binding protein
VSTVTPAQASEADFRDAESPMLVSVQRAAGLLGVHPRTIHRLVADGELPFVKIGRRTLLSTVRLEQWVAEREVSPGKVDAA